MYIIYHLTTMEVFKMIKKYKSTNDGKLLRFGVELEGYYPNDYRNDLQLKLNTAFDGVGNPPKVRVEHGGEHHLEIAFYDSETRGNDGLDQWDRVFDVVKACGMLQKPFTGLHVHHDTTDLTPLEVCNTLVLYHNFRHVMELCLPESRKGNQTNLRMVHGSAFQDLRAILVDDYSYLDMHNKIRTPAYVERISGMFGHCQDIGVNGRFHTIEFRKGISTTDFERFTQWIMFTQGFVKRAMELSKPKSKKPQSLFSQEKLDSFKHFKPTMIDWKIDYKSWGRHQLKGSQTGKLWGCRYVYQYIAEKQNVGDYHSRLLQTRDRQHQHKELRGMTDFFESLNNQGGV